VKALDREQKNTLASGELTMTDNAIDTTTGTLKLKALFANKDNGMFPNQFVNVRLQVDTEVNALVVPVNAIQRGSMGTFVYQVKDDNTVTLKKVRTHSVDGDWVSIEGDVQPGDRLVTDGADRLREGARVEVIENVRGKSAAAAAAAVPAAPAKSDAR
jgi:multidrug efflux system membrane fusion protein